MSVGNRGSLGVFWRFSAAYPKTPCSSPPSRLRCCSLPISGRHFELNRQPGPLLSRHTRLLADPQFSERNSAGHVVTKLAIRCRLVALPLKVTNKARVRRAYVPVLVSSTAANDGFLLCFGQSIRPSHPDFPFADSNQRTFSSPIGVLRDEKNRSVAGCDLDRHTQPTSTVFPEITSKSCCVE